MGKLLHAGSSLQNHSQKLDYNKQWGWTYDNMWIGTYTIYEERDSAILESVK